MVLSGTRLLQRARRGQVVATKGPGESNHEFFQVERLGESSQLEWRLSYINAKWVY